MGSKEWLKAAETVEAQKRQPEVEAKEIKAAADYLERFLFDSVEGTAARRLLTATDKHIILGELPASPGRAVVCFLDGEGLKKSIDGKGLSGAYGNQQLDVSSSTSEQAVKAFTHSEHGTRKPKEIVNYLRRELDKIAEGIKQG